MTRAAPQFQPTAQRPPHRASPVGQTRVVEGRSDARLPTMDEWVEAECIRLDDEARARLWKTNPKLAEAEEQIEAVFGRGTPGTPFMRVMLKMEYARRFKGAKVIVADSFAEVSLHAEAMGSAVVL